MKRKRSVTKSRPKPNHKSKNTGPGKASGIKPTDRELDKRIREAADLISSGHRRSQINEILCGRYGVHWRTVAEYSSRARELLIEESGRPLPEHRAEVFDQYQVILRDKKATRGDKLQALKGKREMFGIDAPRRSELSGPDGEALTITAQVGVDGLEQLSDEHINGILDRWQARRAQGSPIINLRDSRSGPESG